MRAGGGGGGGLRGYCMTELRPFKNNNNNKKMNKLKKKGLKEIKVNYYYFQSIFLK